MSNVKNLYSYLDLIKLKIGMYIGEKSLSALYFHIIGYQAACHTKEIHEKLEPNFNLFHDFVANYYLRSESTAGWRNIILAECYGDEEVALETFFALFEDFRKKNQPTNSKKILVNLLEKIILNEDNLENIQHQLSASEYNAFKILLSKLASVEFLSEYDNIFIKINSLAVNSKKLQGLLVENQDTP